MTLIVLLETNSFLRLKKITKETSPEPEPPKKIKQAKSEKKTEIEVLNPKATPVRSARLVSGVRLTFVPLGSQASVDHSSEADDEDEEDLEPIPDLTPALLEFSNIPLHQFEQSFKFIQSHPRQVMLPDSYDRLVIGGFRAAVKGRTKYAKQCVHQALVIQYSEKLGKDGVGRFFKR